MALLDMEKVGGHAAAPVSTTAAPWPSDLAPLDSAQVEGLTLRRILDRPNDEVSSGGSLRLLDARTGAPVAIVERLATDIARSAHHHEPSVRQATLLHEPQLAARDVSGSLCRFDIEQDENRNK